MLTLTADVNGHVIGKVFIHNTGKTNLIGEHVYDAAFVGDGDMMIGLEGFTHDRNDGWNPLAACVLDVIRYEGRNRT